MYTESTDYDLSDTFLIMHEIAQGLWGQHWRSGRLPDFGPRSLTGTFFLNSLKCDQY
jgi:hypothetical protein